MDDAFLVCLISVLSANNTHLLILFQHNKKIKRVFSEGSIMQKKSPSSTAIRLLAGH